MNQTDRLGRDLAAWFVETAAPRTPDYTDDIIRLTAAARQRPRWTFPERWLPMSVSTLARVSVRPLPWRTIGALALLALLLAAVAAAYIGSRPRLPAPFGPAANGLVAYAEGGDIYTVDPATGTRFTITRGPEADRAPRFSLDGTQLAFLRVRGSGEALVVAAADGASQRVLRDTPFVNVDGESLAWSPDGVSIALVAGPGRPEITIVNTSTGEATATGLAHLDGELYWRPPDGRQLLFRSDAGLSLYSVEDGSIELLLTGDAERDVDRASGWTPDGRRLAFMASFGTPPGTTYFVDPSTGEETAVPVGYGQLSNDGTRIVGLNGDDTRTWLCVASVEGGPCGPISAIYNGPWGTYYRWSPDDEWIITNRSDDVAFVLHPDGPREDPPAWFDGGAESWQRIAP